MTEPTASPTASPGVHTEEQAALRQSVAALLDKRSDPAAVRAAMASEHG
ncbi:MAG: acyl-CoA dehydrogenase, partial [Dietzia sp.]|nr:acyl-CoA dehydrogenase [Dietzia sp.]